MSSLRVGSSRTSSTSSDGRKFPVSFGGWLWQPASRAAASKAMQARVFISFGTTTTQILQLSEFVRWQGLEHGFESIALRARRQFAALGQVVALQVSLGADDEAALGNGGG